MCYPKPGPRCSAHAKKTLNTAAFNYQVEPNIFTYETLQEAQADFDSTPAGQKHLRAKMSAAKANSDEYFEYQNRLALGAEKRSQALAAYEKKTRKLVNEDTEKVVNEKKISPKKLFRVRPKAGEVFSLPHDEMEPISPLVPHSDEIDTIHAPSESSMRIDYTESCSTPGCNGNPHVSSACLPTLEVHGYTWTNPYNLVREAMGITDDSYMSTDEVMDIVDHSAIMDPGFYPKTDLTVTSEMNSEGKEVPTVILGRTLKLALQDLYYSKPNAVDRQGVLSYARAEGISTVNKNPLLAAKALTEEHKLTKKQRQQIANAQTVKVEKVPLQSVSTARVSTILEKTGSYRFSQGDISSEIAGVLIARNDSTGYELVGSYERFKGLRSAITDPRSTGKFIILS